MKCGHLGHTPVPLCSPSPERAIRLVSVGSTGSTGKRERPRQHCQPQVPRSQMRTGWGLGPRAEGGATTCPPRGAVPSVSGSPASRTPPVVHGGPARPQLGRGSAGSGFWRRGQDLTQAVTMKALPTPKVRGCGEWHPSLRRPGSKGRQDGRESVPDSEGLQTRHAHTPLYTRAHAPTSTHKHTCMHGLIHVCTHPETHAHTSTSASLYQTLLEYSEKEAPRPRKGGVLCQGAPRIFHLRFWD